MMPYKSFDNDINGTCIPQINKTKRLLCIYNLAIKQNHQISKSLNYPPTRPKLLTIARLSHVYLHISKGHISTDSWELFSVNCTCRCSGPQHCIIYNKALCNSTYLTLQYKIIANLDYRWLFPHPAKHMDHPESTFIFPKNPVH